MNNGTSRCPECEAPVSPGEETCDNCGLNLVTGESYEQKLKRSQGEETPPESAARVGGAGLVVGFCLVMFAGFMYQRGIMKAFRAKPDQSEKYVQHAQKVRYLAHRCRKAETASERRRFRRTAENTAEALLESLDPGGAGDGRQKNNDDEESDDLTGKWKIFRYNLRNKVKYYLSRLPKR